MPVIDDTTEHAHELAALTVAVRQLMLAAATTDLAPAELRTHRADIEAATAALSRASRPRIMRSDFAGPQYARDSGESGAWPIFRYNPQAMPLEMMFDGDTASARTVASALYEGPPECVHGGYLSHLLDCLLGTLIQATGRRAVTATLDLRYLAPTPLDVELELQARIVSSTGRKVVAEAWVSHAGVRTVEAHGLFIDVESRPRETPLQATGAGAIA